MSQTRRSPPDCSLAAPNASLGKFLKERYAEDHRDCSFLALCGHWRGKFNVPEGDMKTFYQLVEQAVLEWRSVGLPLPIALTEQRTPVYTLFHDVDASCSLDEKDDLERRLSPGGKLLDAIVEAHMDLLGTERLRVLVLTCARELTAKAKYKHGVHLFFFDEEDQPVLVDARTALKLVAFTRHRLGERTDGEGSVIDATVHQTNGLRIPYVSKFVRSPGCPDCASESFLDRLRERPSGVCEGLDLAPLSMPAKHKGASLASQIASLSCGCASACKWKVYEKYNDLCADHGEAGCYKGQVHVPHAYTFEGFYRYEKAEVGRKDGPQVDYKDLLPDATVSWVLAKSRIRSAATEPTARIVEAFFAPAADHYRPLAPTSDKPKSRKRKAAEGEAGGEAKERERPTGGNVPPELVSALRANRELQIRAPDMLNELEGATFKGKFINFHSGTVPCSLAGKVHGSNRTSLEVSSTYAILRCMDSTCQADVRTKKKKWLGVRLALPAPAPSTKLAPAVNSQVNWVTLTSADLIKFAIESHKQK